MKKYIILFLISFFLINSISLLTAERVCKECCKKSPVKKCCEEFPYLRICFPPGGDSPDDNYSFGEDNGNRFYFITPEVLIFKSGYYEVYKNDHIGERQNAFTDLTESLEILRNSGKVLLIPSGAFTGKAVDSFLKKILNEYVRIGGTIIVFAQQFGSHFDNVVPVPEGESLKSYGWREDQSCYFNSIYLNDMHPVVSSSYSKTVWGGDTQLF